MKTGFFFPGYSRLLVPRHLWAQLPKAYKTPTPISHVKSSAHFTTEHSSTHWRAVCITINTPGRTDTPKSIKKMSSLCLLLQYYLTFLMSCVFSELLKAHQENAS